MDKINIFRRAVLAKQRKFNHFRLQVGTATFLFSPPMMVAVGRACRTSSSNMQQGKDSAQREDMYRNYEDASTYKQLL